MDICSSDEELKWYQCTLYIVPNYAPRLLKGSSASLKQLKIAYKYILVVITSLIVRHFVYTSYWIFSNDDIAYFSLAENLISGRGYTIDGLAHTHFPPLYPSFLALFSLLSIKPALVLYLHYMIGTLAISIIAWWIVCYLTRQRNLFYFLFIFLNPLFLIGNATLGLSSETLFVILVLSAFLLFIWYLKSANFLAWFLSSLFVGLAYLTREEGMVFFIWHLWHLGLCFKERSEMRIRLAMSFALAFFVTVIPYVLYLSIQTGQLTISGKLIPISESYENRWGPFDPLKGLWDTIVTFVSSPFLNNPIVMSICFAISIFMIWTRETTKFSGPIWYLFLPFLPLLVILSITNPLGRAMYILASFLIILFCYNLTWLNVNFSWKWLRIFSPIISTITLLTMVGTTSYAYFGGTLDKSPHYMLDFAEEAAGIELNSSDSINIYSRSKSIVLLDSRFRLCSEILTCPKLDYAILTNSIHTSLMPLTEFERKLAVSVPRYIDGCFLLSRRGEGDFSVLLYRCLNDS